MQYLHEHCLRTGKIAGYYDKSQQVTGLSECIHVDNNIGSKARQKVAKVSKVRRKDYIIYLYYTLRFYFPYLSLLAQPVTIFVYGPVTILLYGPAIIILDKKYNIANSSCHFESYGSIWTGPSPKQKLYGPQKLRSI